MKISPKAKIILACILVAFGLLSRLLPHAWNFTPITAIVLFASAYLGLRYSFVLLMVVMFVSDAVLGFYHWQIMLAVYGSFALAAIAGSFIKPKAPVTILVSTLGASLAFFLVTNWAVWQFGTMYAHSFDGLLQSYVMAVPFFRNALAGDLVYTSLLFGVAELCLYLVRKMSPRPALN